MPTFVPPTFPGDPAERRSERDASDNHTVLISGVCDRAVQID